MMISNVHRCNGAYAECMMCAINNSIQATTAMFHHSHVSLWWKLEDIYILPAFNDPMAYLRRICSNVVFKMKKELSAWVRKMLGINLIVLILFLPNGDYWRYREWAVQVQWWETLVGKNFLDQSKMVNYQSPCKTIWRWRKRSTSWQHLFCSLKRIKWSLIFNWICGKNRIVLQISIYSTRLFNKKWLKPLYTSTDKQIIHVYILWMKYLHKWVKQYIN